MNQNNQITELPDDLLENIGGGYLQVSKWRTFISTQVMPVLHGLMSSASGSDQAVINNVCSILQGTMIPDANIAEPVRALWSNYNTTYRPRLQSDAIKRTMDQALYTAKQYIEQNA